ncbi:hypothetical protein [Streptomyces cyaneofuscatus]|uniref:hypothetical protein n=1 Tax=Streptomyces cyaneofuscatus TaxID=66883 RepID=UPI0036AB7ABC
MATLALGAAGEVAAAAPVVWLMPSVATLQVNFNDNVVDTVSRWPRSYGSISETGGRARVPCTTGYAAYARLTSARAEVSRRSPAPGHPNPRALRASGGEPSSTVTSPAWLPTGSCTRP